MIKKKNFNNAVSNYISVFYLGSGPVKIIQMQIRKIDLLI